MSRETRMYLIVIVLCAVITATGQILSQNWPHIFRYSTDRVPEKVEGKTPQTTDLPSGDGSNIFGKWVKLEKNVTYKAESDGFIAAYTGGKSPASGFHIYVGKQLNNLTILTRAGQYDGTVCPVSNGDYWQVRASSGGEVVVHWLPISQQ